MEKELRFDEGFDNILIYDYDEDYKRGPLITSNTLIESCGRNGLSLDGEWNFCPDLFHSVVRSRWFDEVKYNRSNLPIPYDFSFEDWEKVKVPGIWNNQKKEYALYEGSGVYFKEFSYKKTGDKRTFLRIGAANYETRIWLNKRYLGRHLGGFTPFCVDVTDFLEEDNRLLITVDNTRKGEQVPSLHYDWFNYGGIHRNVELIETPLVFIKNHQIQLSKTVKHQLDYQITIASCEGDENAVDSVEATIAIPDLNIREAVLCFRQEKDKDLTGQVCYYGTGSITIDENSIDLWSPVNPSLYEVAVQCQEDQMTDFIGFRRIEVQGEEIILNGEKVFLKGMCVHEESPENLRAVTLADMEYTLKTAKDMGCNFLRLTHYPHNENTARLADQMGIMLLEEIPVYWALEFENPQTFQDASNQLRELILRDRNRASVIIWSVGNENPDTDHRYDFMQRLVAIARNMDQSRLIGASCLIDVESCRIRDRLIDKLDVVGINEYYGWYIKDYGILETILNNYKEGKPVIITETGADAVCGKHGEANEIYTEECQAEVYEKQFEILLKYPFIRGVTPWILFDYASMRRMSILQKGYNLKGIIGADRVHRKKAYDTVKKIYQNRIDTK